MAVKETQDLLAGLLCLVFDRELEFGCYQIVSVLVVAVSVWSGDHSSDPPGEQFTIARAQQSTTCLEWVGYLRKMPEIRKHGFE
jgi:hypothetical protein